MRRLILMAAGLAPLALTLLAFAALASAAPHFQEVEEPTVSACEPGLYKTVTPDRLLLGQSAQVTLVMTHTCPSAQTPIDIMFVVDESNSMTRAAGDPGMPPPGGPERTPTVEPIRTPPLLILGEAGLNFDLSSGLPFETFQDPGPPPPEPPPGSGPGPGDGDPPGCGGNDSGGPGLPPGPEPPPGPGPGPLTAAERSALSGMSVAIIPALRDGDSPNQASRTPTVNPRGTPTPTSEAEEGEPAGSEDLIRDVRDWLNDFVDDERIQADIDSGNLRLGMVAFNARARTIVKLSEFDQAHRVASLSSRLRGQDETRIDMGFQRAITELGGTTRILGGSEGRKQFVVILSDGAFCLRDLRRVRESREIQIATVSFGRSGWEHRLNDLASESRFAFTSPELEAFLEIYHKELSSAAADEIVRLVFKDELRENMQLVPGSVVPLPSGIDGQTIRWDALRAGEEITTTPRITIAPVITLTYEIEPQEPGSHFVSYDAIARWRDTQGLPGLGIFPPVVVEVIPPTPTPTYTSTPTNTPTSTPTATPTPQPLPRYFPIAF
ncbi:MAG TPA: VWA domain-containing protein, partial [Longimicrobiaceae bacterium]|nr:VWA domain-containing protein [Longimicrobiaceae bacterium]